MSTRAKRSNLLGPRASHIEKARLPRDELPSWYYRLLRLEFDREPFEPRDPSRFDEDLSELEEESEQEEDVNQVKFIGPEYRAEQREEKDKDCECGGEDSECDCQFSDDDDASSEPDYDSEDDESERSYDGSDASDYYEMKAEREERKRELLREKKQNQNDKEQRLQLEKSKETEVGAVFESVKNAGKEETSTIPFESLAGQYFKLFCSDHVNHFYKNEDNYDNKTIEFRQAGEVEELRTIHRFLKSPKKNSGMLYGHLFLDEFAQVEFGPFWPPSRASRHLVMVKSRDEKHTLAFQFLGDGYFKLRVSRDMVFMVPDDENPEDVEDPPPSAPREFEFVGIWCDREKDLEEQRKQRLERERARRSPSPRETWFELNHPMGAYYKGGWDGPW